MKTVDTSNLKGTEDYYGEYEIIRNYIIDTIKNSFINYGYLPLDTAILNNYDVLSYKYQDDAEILSEIYKLTDQGNRNLGLRYDLTIPFCKYIANQKELKLPFRRYEIGKVFRNGPVKAGRMREFYQCDADVVGIDGNDIEIEQMIMAITTYQKLGIEPIVKWNNRKLMSSLIEYIDSNLNKETVIGIIDKMEKISKEELLKEFNKVNIDTDTANKLLDIFNKDIEFYNNLNLNNELYQEAIKEINYISNKLNYLNLENNTKFTPTLARGLSIYTGTVFEFYDKEEKLKCSIGSGGRYNKIITNFINDGNIYPAVGLSFGLEPIYTIIKDKFNNKSSIDIYIVPMDDNIEGINLATTLRNNNLNVLVELNKKKLNKCFEYADKNNIKYLIILGSEEIENKVYTIKNMQTKEQLKLNINELLDYINK